MPKNHKSDCGCVLCKASRRRSEIVVAKPAQALDRPIAPKLTAGDVENLKGVLANVYAKNTKIAYESDWKVFVAFCESRSASALPAHPAVVVAYIAALAKGEIPDQHGKLAPRKLATIQRHLVSISTKHKLADLESPRESKEVRLAMRSISRTIGEPQRRKAAAVDGLLYKMVLSLPHTPARTRDTAILLVGLFGGFRQSEIVGIDVDHLTAAEDMLHVLIPRSKTDQSGKGRTVGLVANPGQPGLCAITAIARLRATLPAPETCTLCRATGRLTLPDKTIVSCRCRALFRRILRDGSYGDRLRPNAVAKLVKRCAKRVGLDPKSFAGHSLRAGFVTTAKQAGADLFEIREQTGHKSIVQLEKYVRDVVTAENHVGTKIIRRQR